MAFDKHMLLRTGLILVAAVVLFGLISYYNSKQSTAASEKFLEEQLAAVEQEGKKKVHFADGFTNDADAPVASNPEEETHRAVDYETKQIPSDCFPKDRLTAADLLPSDVDSKWAQVNPAGQGDVQNINFLTAGYQVGINTTQGSMKNPNLQLRSDPVIAKTSAWPILNSSYTPDLLRKPLEIGGDC